MLGVGRIVPKPWVHEGELAVRQVVQLSLTFDHRVCDGGTAGGFLRYRGGLRGTAGGAAAHALITGFARSGPIVLAVGADRAVIARPPRVPCDRQGPHTRGVTAYEPPGDPGTEAYDAVVLAGGAARRLGGADKPGVRVGGRALLDRVLPPAPTPAPTVVVAEPRPTARPVRWAREDPPGRRPARRAGRRTAAHHRARTSSSSPPTCRSWPRTTVRRLLDRPRTARAPPRASLLTDPDGRDQPLVAAYRAERRCAASSRGSPPNTAASPGCPLRRLTAALRPHPRPRPRRVLRLRHLGRHRRRQSTHQGAWPRVG